MACQLVLLACMCPYCRFDKIALNVSTGRHVPCKKTLQCLDFAVRLPLCWLLRVSELIALANFKLSIVLEREFLSETIFERVSNACVMECDGAAILQVWVSPPNLRANAVLVCHHRDVAHSRLLGHGDAMLSMCSRRTKVPIGRTC